MIVTLWKENKTLRELVYGIIVFGLIIQVILAIFFPPVVFRAVGLWIGVLCGVGMAVHMAYCLETLVLLDEKGATAYAKKTSVIRYMVVCVILAATAISGIGDPISFVFGIIGLKAGAYMQPLTHKVCTYVQNKFNKGGE